MSTRAVDLLRTYREECLRPPILKHDAELCSLAIALLEACPTINLPELDALIERATPTVDKTNRRTLEKYKSEMYWEWIKIRDSVEEIEQHGKSIINLPCPPELTIPPVCDDGVTRLIPAVYEAYLLGSHNFASDIDYSWTHGSGKWTFRDHKWDAKKSLTTWDKPGVLAWHLTATFHPSWSGTD